MSTDLDRSCRLLDVTGAEVSADATEAEVLSKAARHAEALGPAEVKEHVGAALAHASRLRRDRTPPTTEGHT